MMKGIFDSHAHYLDARFDTDRETLLRSLPQNGVAGVIECATDLASSHEAVRLASRFPYVYAAVGYHPEEVNGLSRPSEEDLQPLLTLPKVVAVGEIGLDYYWDKTGKENQKEWFVRQIRLANAYRLPVIVHDRDAHEDTLAILERERPRGVVHAFSGSVEMMRRVTAIGMSVGLGGVVTFKNARKTVEVAKEVPPDRLLLETDAPYLAPEPFRGRRNDSTLIRLVAQKIAEIRGVSPDDIIRMTALNAAELFDIEEVRL